MIFYVLFRLVGDEDDEEEAIRKAVEDSSHNPTSHSKEESFPDPLGMMR